MLSLKKLKKEECLGGSPENVFKSQSFRKLPGGVSHAPSSSRDSVTFPVYPELRVR
jgi:hypothetical protein